VYRFSQEDATLLLDLVNNKPIVLENLVQGQVAVPDVLGSDLLILTNFSAQDKIISLIHAVTFRAHDG
jgi:hypothetical protein